MKKNFLSILWILLQCIWCTPQNLIGLVLHLIHRKNGYYHFRGAIVTAWKHEGCTSLGAFIFMEQSCLHHERLLVHEYGHTVQNAVLGWLYPLVIVIPSMLWYHLPMCQHYRKRKQFSYYRFYTEKWANAWGEKVCKMPSVR
ncbi:MAG: hypothetical protein V3G42_04720 [Oscillospiraceae bacterium]